MAQKNAQPITSTEHIPPGEHGRGFPPFDATTFASQLLWLAITFIALYLLMSRIALPRIGKILEQRKARIEGDLRQAERLKEESNAAIAAYQDALAAARARAQTLANEMREKQAAEAEAARKKLDARLNADIAVAEKRIAATRTAAMANVTDIATEAATALVQRLIGAAPSAQEVGAAVADVLKR